MQKPNYIKIQIPVSRFFYRLLSKKFGTSLTDKIADLNFGAERNRKYFEYQIIECRVLVYSTIDSDQKNYFLELRLTKITD